MPPVLLQALLQAENKSERYRKRSIRWETEQGMYWDGKSFEDKVVGLQQGDAKLGRCVLRITAQTQLPVFSEHLPANPGVSPCTTSN